MSKQEIDMAIRVQIPVYTDRWMMGDRFGEIIRVTRRAIAVPGEANKFKLRDIASVKLDKSGKRVRVLLDDCEMLPWTPANLNVEDKAAKGKR